MVGSLFDITKIPELRKRVLFTLGMLAVYRLGVFVSVPGINVAMLRQRFQGTQGTVYDFINLFSGGALENFSLFTLGIAPYITVSILVQLLTYTIPALERLRKDGGEAGRRIITRYTRQGTVVLGLIQAFAVATSLEAQGLVMHPGWTFRITAMATLTAGTAFIMWLGEQINERGIGNGISIIIFGGIAARMPQVFVSTVALSRTGELSAMTVLLLLTFCVLTVAGIIFVERSYRKIPVQYPRRMVGKRMAQAQTQFLPLKVNMTSIYPAIFASSVFMFLATINAFAQSEWVQQLTAMLHAGSLTHDIIFVGLVGVFTFFFLPMFFNPVELADSLKKNGGFIPTVRPGKETADFLTGTCNRLAVWGILYMAVICVLPQRVYLALGDMTFAYVFSGTAILIVVGVTLDTASQIESYIVARNYEAFMSTSTKQRGGMGSMSYTRSKLLRR